MTPRIALASSEIFNLVVGRIVHDEQDQKWLRRAHRHLRNKFAAYDLINDWVSNQDAEKRAQARMLMAHMMAPTMKPDRDDTGYQSVVERRRADRKLVVKSNRHNRRCKS